MDNFKAIYHILTHLERHMDDFSRSMENTSPEQLGVTNERLAAYIEMLTDEGYIKGASITKGITGDVIVKYRNMRITLKGLEYLQENSIMQRMHRETKGIVEIVS